MMIRILLRPLLVLLALTAPLAAQTFETRAGSAWVLDLATHTVLMDKNGVVPLPPASMSKLMTLNMLFEALKDGRVALDTTFAVSTKAREMEGSTMFLNEQDRPTAEELIRGIIINSGNDACVVVAEGLAGTEEAFAIQMTERARALGLEHSTFANASGWPHPDHRMSMKDLGLLAQRLIEVFPEFYPIFSETSYDYKNRAPANANNRNPLLGLGIGADGLKTGHTQEAGYGLVGSVRQGDRRIVFAINGLASEQERAEEAERIATWAFRQFSLKTVVTAGTRIAEAEVFMGTAETVGLVPAADLRLLIPALAHDGLTAEVIYQGPLSAPVTKGSEVATLVINVPTLPQQRIPLLAEADVAKGGFMSRLTAAALQLRARYLPGA